MTTKILPKKLENSQKTIKNPQNLTKTLKKIIPTKNINYSIPEDGILPGGRLQRFLHHWKKTTTHKWPISVISQGYQLQFINKPRPWKTYTQKLSQEDFAAKDSAVEKFLQAGIIERSHTQNRDYLSNLFTIQEATKRRPILDCRKLNQFLQCQHFKMEGIPALREILEPNDYICKLDLKGAYVVVPIHPASQRYLTFDHKGIVYNYKTLAFGISSAPLIFTKLMRFAVEYLRKKGIRMVYYLDDHCILGKTKEETISTTKKVIQHLQDLGFLINFQKSSLTPLKQQEFLGFSFNTETMKILAPQDKICKLIQRLKQALQTQTQRSCRWIASLLGKMTALIPAIGEALLHIRYLQRDLAKSLSINQQDWEKPCPLSATSIDELHWWKTFVTTKNGLPIRQITDFKQDIVIHVDASDIGWGVSSPTIQTTGRWTPREKDHSINVRELKTILFALQLHAKDYVGKKIKIMCDNITAIKYTTRSGGTSSPFLQDLAIKIQDICNIYNLQVQYQHIAGVKNIDADKLSRRQFNPLYEATIPQTVFHLLQKKWGPFRVDAFAARENTQLPTYWSFRADPLSAEIDAFQQNWKRPDLYCFPLWKLIPHVLHKIKRDQTPKIVLITPYWTAQHWWPTLQRIRRLSQPIKFQLNQWTMTAWLLSGKNKEKQVW